ncbi:MAG TPA: homoserine dehydrogenase [Atribacteraceae bacterium]|nr:homoserine dehydrogenase [Atribacteraceae bacterium]
MKEVQIAVIGFGIVGAGTIKVLWDRKDEIENDLSLPINVSRVVDRDWFRERSLAIPPEIKSDDPDEVIENPDIQIIVEAIGGVDPAYDIVSRALRAGKTVVTPNKELIAKKGRELLALAAEHRTDLFFEGAVGGGIPIIHALRGQLTGDKIVEIAGIVNGTTNYILSEMAHSRAPYHLLLDEAKRKGYAEPVPTSDVEGYDATYKISILASLCFHCRVNPDTIFREGITRIIPEDIEYARELGYVVKLLAIAKRINDVLELRVHPVFLPNEHPLAMVDGVENAIFVRTKTRELTFRGPGAGGEATGSALVGDIIEAIRNLKMNCRGRVECACQGEYPVKPIENLEIQYCVRTHALDSPGVLAQIATEFGKVGVSLSAVKQPVSTPGEPTNIYFLTHQVVESRLRKAMEKIRLLEVVKDAYAIRVLGEHR